MKVLLTIWLLLLLIEVHSQNRTADFSYIDRKVQSIDGTDPEILSQQLTTPYQTEIEKVRAIFRWITEHIAYFKREPPNRKKQKKLVPYDFDYPIVYDTGALQPLTERAALKVLHDKKAVCEGYARLFKSLCDHAGIRSEIITGFARTDPSIVQARFRSNHSWNAVRIDSAWYLLDVTWASGVIIFPTGEFLKYYDDYYFLTPPDKFIKHHYPDDLHWALLDELPAMNEFRQTPYRQRSFVKYPIINFSPATGLIEASIGDTLRFELETEPGQRNWTISSDSLWDGIDQRNPMFAYLQPMSSGSSNKQYYLFPVVSEDIQWLHLMYNNDAVLRYRLKIKKDIAKENKNGTY
ncbi:MAG TPA: transglutaminase domain-containing protein [Chitinophagaceae bacterium]